MQRIFRGKFIPEQIMAEQREAEIQIKTVNMVIQAYAVTSKNKRTIAGMEKMNLLDENTAVDLGLGDMEVDKIKCPEKGIIIRQECLDRSGEKKNYDTCKECENYEITRQLLLTD